MFLLLVSYSADFLETLKKGWLEVATANDLLPLYEEIINSIAARFYSGCQIEGFKS